MLDVYCKQMPDFFSDCQNEEDKCNANKKTH